MIQSKTGNSFLLDSGIYEHVSEGQRDSFRFQTTANRELCFRIVSKPARSSNEKLWG